MDVHRPYRPTVTDVSAPFTAPAKYENIDSNKPLSVSWTSFKASLLFKKKE